MMIHQIKEAADYLSIQGVKSPEIGVVLGTGLGHGFLQYVKNAVTVDYKNIPHFPESTMEFHKGKLWYGEISGKQILVMQGRYHYYEGYSMQQITLPIRVMKALGIKHLLISNAAGNMNLNWKKGELMLIDDHINLQPDNPLRGTNFEELGGRFPDMSQPYSKRLNEKLIEIASNKNIKLNVGVYACVTGPNLETRAEYRYLQRIGADAVGMSTVPEVIVANHAGLPCCAVSVLTDDCDPDNLQPAKIAEIIEIAGKAENKLTELYVELINAL
ncbi:MAG TPA: purine-nucleoside phosphorylase [Chryseolinea sp.]|nr:purine-nucleoside phosphorylase [Chryseolinea sp.]